VRVDSASVFTCLRIALRIRPENGLTKVSIFVQFFGSTIFQYESF